MSVTGQYWRLSAEEWSRLEPYLEAEVGTDYWREGDQAFVDSLQIEWVDTDRTLDLQKEWHILHCLLTDRWEKPGEIMPAPPPLGNAVWGGTSTPFEAHDGMVRYLLPPEVREVADALSKISVDELLSKVDMDVVREAGVYSWGPESVFEQVEVVVREELTGLVGFFAEAARANNVVVLALL